MNLSLAEQPSRSPADQAADLHVLTLVANHPRAALQAVDDGLEAPEAEFCGLSLKPVGRIIEATLRLRGLDERGAERLAARLAGCAGVWSAKVEHLVERHGGRK